MEASRKIVIGNKMMTRKELFEEEGKFRKEQAKLLFEEKIRALVDLQKIAYNWGKKRDVIIWRSEERS